MRTVAEDSKLWGQGKCVVSQVGVAPDLSGFRACKWGYRANGGETEYMPTFLLATCCESFNSLANAFHNHCDWILVTCPQHAPTYRDSKETRSIQEVSKSSPITISTS